MPQPACPELSIVIPLFNEAENIPGLAVEIVKVFDQQPFEWECLWVDDGSSDSSPELLQALEQIDPRFRTIRLSSRSGQSAALWAGFAASRSEVIATLDGDRQNDPADLPGLLVHLRDQHLDMVVGIRRRRNDRLAVKIASRVANFFRAKVLGDAIRDVGCATRVFKKHCLFGLPRFKGLHRFLPVLVGLNGLRVAQRPVNHQARRCGRTNYSIANRLGVGLVDLAGVYWLKRRAIAYTISDPRPLAANDQK